MIAWSMKTLLLIILSMLLHTYNMAPTSLSNASVVAFPDSPTGISNASSLITSVEDISYHQDVTFYLTIVIFIALFKTMVAIYRLGVYILQEFASNRDAIGELREELLSMKAILENNSKDRPGVELQEKPRAAFETSTRIDKDEDYDAETSVPNQEVRSAKS